MPDSRQLDPLLGLDCTGPTDVFLLISLVNKAALLYIALASRQVEMAGPSGWDAQPYSTAGTLERHCGSLCFGCFCFTSLLTTASSLPRSPSSLP